MQVAAGEQNFQWIKWESQSEMKIQKKKLYWIFNSIENDIPAI